MTLADAIAAVGPVAVWRMGDQYLAARLSITHPGGRVGRATWDTHPTPEDALAALVAESRTREPSVSVDGKAI